MGSWLHVTYLITGLGSTSIPSVAIPPRRYQTLTTHHGRTQQEQFRLARLVLVYYNFNIILAIKRIMQEARELANDPCTDYSAAPLEVRSFSIGQ